jgi:hypothetical protein
VSRTHSNHSSFAQWSPSRPQWPPLLFFVSSYWLVNKEWRFLGSFYPSLSMTPFWSLRRGSRSILLSLFLLSSNEVSIPSNLALFLRAQVTGSLSSVQRLFSVDPSMGEIICFYTLFFQNIWQEVNRCHQQNSVWKYFCTKNNWIPFRWPLVSFAEP